MIAKDARAFGLSDPVPVKTLFTVDEFDQIRAAPNTEDKA